MLTLRMPTLADQDAFIAAMQASHALHHPWVKAPSTPEEFQDYHSRFTLENQQGYLLLTPQDQIAGVFNISDISRRNFQSAYLGFYAVQAYANQGLMDAGLKLLLKKAFAELSLHRLEANIQPENHRSIKLVKNNGFRKEGLALKYLKINGEWRDHEHWAMTVEDWQARIWLRTPSPPGGRWPKAGRGDLIPSTSKAVDYEKFITAGALLFTLILEDEVLFLKAFTRSVNSPTSLLNFGNM